MGVEEIGDWEIARCNLPTVYLPRQLPSGMAQICGSADDYCVQHRIESLTDTQAKLPQKTISKPIKGWTEEAESLVQLANTFKGQNVLLHSETFSLLKVVALFTQTVVEPSSELDRIWAELKKVRRALSKLETAVERSAR